jgi:hypothetical protein
VAYLVLILMLVFPAATFARDDDTSGGDTQEENQRDASWKWGVSIWGLSYHINRRLDFNEQNWGLGIRRYAKPRWRWLGQSADNRLLFEADALRNSHNGLIVPLSAGVEYKIGTFSNCKLFPVAAFAFAYYENPTKHKSDFRYGPVPAFEIGCGRIRSNTMLVLNHSRQFLSAIVGSVTVVF